MDSSDAHLTVRLAETRADLLAAHRLRYRVFVAELGGTGELVDHEAGLERDRFDPFFDHMILVDTRRDPGAGDHVVGVYRLMRSEQAEEAGQFYSEDEYDLGPLRASGRRLVELGRSCLDPAYRGGTSLFRLWQGLGAYVLEHDLEVLFGVASFHGTDPESLAHPLSFLHHRHLAAADLRVRSRVMQRMDLLSPNEIDRTRAVREMPSLIKAYLRLGGAVGEGAFIDHPFNTTDVCLVMDTARMGAAIRARYGGAGR